jgi:hypothetical protein
MRRSEPAEESGTSPKKKLKLSHRYEGKVEPNPERVPSFPFVSPPPSYCVVGTCMFRSTTAFRYRSVHITHSLEERNRKEVVRRIGASGYVLH